MNEPSEFEFFRSCVDLEPDEWRRYLDAHCTDTNVRERVEELLLSHQQNAEFGDLDFERPLRWGEELPPGFRLGEYELTDHIGEGGSGAVYRARTTDGGSVAIKVLRHSFMGSVVQSRFRREIKALSLLRHRCIAGYVDSGELGDGTPYLVMEYAEGTALSDCAPAEWTIADRCSVFLRIAEALAHAHQLPVLHRDLKPSNIIVSESREPTVTDFGLARLPEVADQDADLTRSGHVMGTIRYMAPEQVRAGQPHDIRTDIFGLGAILYFLLTSVPPHDADNLHDFSKQVLDAEPKSPAEIDAAVPKDLANICLMCLRQNPNDRYQSVRELMADVSHFLNGEPVLARPVDGLTRVWYWLKKNRLAGSLLVLTAFLTTGLITSLAVMLSDSQDKLSATQEQVQLLRANAGGHRETVASLVERLKELKDKPAELNQRREMHAMIVQLYESQIAEGKVDRDTMYDTAVAYFNLGKVEQDLGNLQAKEDVFRKAYSTFRLLHDRHPDWTEVEFDMFHCERRLELHDLAFERIKRISEGSSDIRFIDGYANQLHYVARELTEAGDYDNAMLLCEDGLQRYEKFCEEYGRDSKYLRHIATYNGLMGRICLCRGEIEKAWQHCQTANRAQSKFVTKFNDYVDYYLELCGYRCLAVDVLALKQDYVNASLQQDAADAAAAECVKRFPQHSVSKRMRLGHWFRRFSLAVVAGQEGLARRLFQQRARELKEKYDENPSRQNALNLVYHQTNAAFGSPNQVADTLQALNLTIPPRNVPTSELPQHAELLFWLGRFREARTAMVELQSRQPDRAVSDLPLCEAIIEGRHEQFLKDHLNEPIRPRHYRSSVLSLLYYRRTIEANVEAAIERSRSAKQ